MVTAKENADRIERLELIVYNLIDKLNRCNLKAVVEFDDLELEDNEEVDEAVGETKEGKTYE
jgi:hypothetical protein